MKVVLIDYGAGNTHSVQFALQRLGISPLLTNAPAEISSADKVLFPGVGHAETAMQALHESGLAKVIPQLKQPFLGICLGMQLLCAHSEEGNTPCLGIINQPVKRFEPLLKVPHMGWNTVEGNCPLGSATDSSFYFVHSYYVPVYQDTTLTTNYIQPFSAAVQHHNFYGVQFHPEKSGTAGETLLKNFLAL